MVDCTCCGCVSVKNYRGQRQRPENITFAVWCNSDREFFDVENNTITTFPTTLASDVDDGGGPSRLVTGGGWVAAGFYTPSGTGSFLQTIKNGTLTIEGVYGSSFTIHVINSNGFLSTDGGPAKIEAWGEEATFTSGVSLDTIAVTSAIQMAYGGQSVVKVGLGQGGAGEQPYTLERFSSTALVDDQDVAGVVTSRSRRGASRNFFTATANQISHQFSVTPTGEAPPGQYANYFRTKVRLQGSKCSLYKNGALAWQATRPQPADSESHTVEDGVYLWVSEVLEAADPPYTGVGIDDRVRVASPLKRQRSFVVDTERPVLGFPPPNDYFIDRVDDVTGQRPYLVATKPIRDWLSADAPETDTTVRPTFIPRTGLSPNGSWFSEAHQAYVQHLPAGTHDVKPRVQLFGTFVDLSTLRDYAGNVPGENSPATFTVTVHPTPANNRRGARPLLEDVGLQTREYGRARLQSERVSTVRLTFDRKVKADTVSASQLTLTKNGETVPGCSLTRVSDVEWLVTLPQDADQTPKSFWVLTYDPAGNVLTDDIDEMEYDSYEKFPTSSRSVYRRVYIAKDTGRRYSKSPSGYIDIGTGKPRDQNDVDFDPEPCRLATRISWLMASENRWLRPIDTSSTDVVIGDTMSITKAIESLPVPDGKFKIVSTGGAIYDWGQTRQGIYADGFTPRVPGPTAPPADCSYWGLTTTIDPCQPAVIRCPVAKSSQRHSSVLRIDDDLESFRLSLVTRDAITGAEIAAPAGVAPYWFGPITVGKTAGGKNLPQNVWFGQIPERLSPNPELNKPANLDVANALWGYAYKDASTEIRYSKSNGDWVAIGAGEPRGPDGQVYPFTGVVKGEAWILALRTASEYASLKTSMLWELEIDATLAFIIRSIDGNTGAVLENQETSRTRIVFSKDKEDAWARGETFYVMSTVPGSFGFWWKFEPAA